MFNSIMVAWSYDSFVFQHTGYVKLHQLVQVCFYYKNNFLLLIISFQTIYESFKDAQEFILNQYSCLYSRRSSAKLKCCKRLFSNNYTMLRSRYFMSRDIAL